MCNSYDASLLVSTVSTFAVGADGMFGETSLDIVRCRQWNRPCLDRTAEEHARYALRRLA